MIIKVLSIYSLLYKGNIKYCNNCINNTRIISEKINFNIVYNYKEKCGIL